MTRTTFSYSPWRHGGWYVDNVRYPSGACGCVSRNYADRKWRIVCDPRPFDERPAFRTRDEAAQAELDLIAAIPLNVRWATYMAEAARVADIARTRLERGELALVKSAAESAARAYAEARALIGLA